MPTETFLGIYDSQDDLWIKSVTDFAVSAKSESEEEAYMFPDKLCRDLFVVYLNSLEESDGRFIGGRPPRPH
jgi:hypothetical protein